jgi:hypothetical protein
VCVSGNLREDGVEWMCGCVSPLLPETHVSRTPNSARFVPTPRACSIVLVSREAILVSREANLASREAILASREANIYYIASREAIIASREALGMPLEDSGIAPASQDLKTHDWVFWRIRGNKIYFNHPSFSLAARAMVTKCFVSKPQLCLPRV